jgi:hypothetical protein
VAIKIKSTKDVHTNGIKLVLYGASGSGKTVMAASAPNPIYISAEKGMLSLADRDIPYMEVKTLKSLEDAFKYCKDCEHDTIVIDSLSEVTQACLDEFTKSMIKESSTGKIDKRQAYGKIAEKIGNMIRNFRDLDGKNVIFIAKERKVEDDSDGTITYEAYLPGKVLPFDLPYLVDEVFCLQITRKGERYIQTVSDYKRICKDRSGTLGNPEQIDFKLIFKKIIAGKQNEE